MRLAAKAIGELVSICQAVNHLSSSDVKQLRDTHTGVPPTRTENGGEKQTNAREYAFLLLFGACGCAP